MRLILDSMPLSDSMYLGIYEMKGTTLRMWTMWYLLTCQVWEKLLAILWGDMIMVRMCLLPELKVSHSVTKSIAILLNGYSGVSVICRG